MKNFVLVSAVIAAISFNACAQSSKEVPANVKASFTQKFPDAQKVKWDKENATEWEAEFKMNGKEYSANFSTDGQWMETEYEISEKDIPAAVSQTLASEFPGAKIDESEISETESGQVYEFEIKKDKETMEVAIKPDGTLVKKESAKEEGEDDDE